MNNYRLYIILACLTLLNILSACVDRLEYNVGGEIPEGYSDVSFTLGYTDFTPALNTRTPGDAIETIRSLFVAIYKEDGSHFKTLDLTDTFRPAGADDNWIGVKPSVSCNMMLPNGSYRMYAVANLDLGSIERANEKGYLTEDELRQIRLNWYAKDPAANNQMFGWFVNGDRDTDRPHWKETPDAVTISAQKTSLHAYLHRCSSKVTVAYDATGLDEGVSIYLMNVSIKDIPTRCVLGHFNTAGRLRPGEEDGEELTKEKELLEDGEMISYFETPSNVPEPGSSMFDSFNETRLSKTDPYYPRPLSPVVTIADRNNWKDNIAHKNDGESLFFFENMQGHDEKYDKSKRSDEIDSNTKQFKKPDGKVFGSYIEVEAIYRVINSETINGVTTELPESGIIRYRFMLGKDTKIDYDSERNHHYKLTLKFKGKPTDSEWHIDYEENFLEVSDPEVMDYRGMIFSPGTKPNLGHDFTEGTTIRVKSFTETEDKSKVKSDYSISYEYDGQEHSELPDWLVLDDTSEGDLPYEDILTFKVNKDVISSEAEKTVNELKKFKSTPAGNSKDNPVNLADPERPCVSPASAKIVNTANCYVIDAPGWYLLPAVYGNGVEDGKSNIDSYKPGGAGLSTFKNHLGKEIQSPYIKEDISKNSGAKAPSHAALIWQDVDGLVDYEQQTYTEPLYTAWGDKYEDIVKVRYIDSAYGGRGGIKFYIANAKEGNAILGLLDRTAQTHWIETDFNGGSAQGPIIEFNQDVIWSWHIWVTSLFTSDVLKNDRTLTVTSAKNGDFDVLPFNLGWCANPGDDPVKYYPGRECKIILKSGDKTVSTVISQKSHISVPCGNNPYYQWGRKDPFVAASDQKNAEDNYNKGMWISKNVVRWANPRGLSMVYANNKKGATYWDNTYWEYGKPDGTDPEKNDGRMTTKDAIDQGALIKYPYLWHNPEAVTPGLNDNAWASVNVIYQNQWGDKGDGKTRNSVKTIYDPCPVGYMVPNQDVFTAFTVEGLDRTNASDWYYDAIDKNIVDKYENVYEFYTNTDKNQSIIFPKSGYRDWDNLALSIWYGSIGYAWTGKFDEYKIHTSYTGSISPLPKVDWIVNFEFSHNDYRGEHYVRPTNKFYGCDGFPIRPIKQPSKQ